MLVSELLSVSGIQNQDVLLADDDLLSIWRLIIIIFTNYAEISHLQARAATSNSPEQLHRLALAAEQMPAPPHNWFEPRRQRDQW